MAPQSRATAAARALTLWRSNSICDWSWAKAESRCCCTVLTAPALLQASSTSACSCWTRKEHKLDHPRQLSLAIPMCIETLLTAPALCHSNFILQLLNKQTYHHKHIFDWAKFSQFCKKHDVALLKIYLKILWALLNLIWEPNALSDYQLHTVHQHNSNFIKRYTKT